MLIEVRARLQHIRHERIIREDIEDYGPIKLMSNYIRTLGEEYARNFDGISRSCTAFEKEIHTYLRSEDALPPPRPTIDMSRCPALEAFLEEDQFRTSDFRTGYDAARSRIEAKLAALLRPRNI